MTGTAWLVRPEGLVPYAVAFDAMHELAELRAAGDIPDVLILLEHPPVYTAGRRADPTHVRWTETQIEAAGAELHHVDRGGSVTFHGPGQLVGYPILDLGSRPDVIAHLRRIERAVILACHDVGVELGRDPEATGVWAGDRKACAIGVKLTRARITLHGFALNCSTDLAWFDAIVPCGLADRGVVSLSELAGRPVTVAEMVPLVATRFQEVFHRSLAPAPPEVMANVLTAGRAGR
ncbi:MAG: lipoyl(octanoyl) transferase LipB [Actinomycetota bacterium]|nr:lipoyl(octanoyl) transferase LipB [Actinomycetota bacterium]